MVKRCWILALGGNDVSPIGTIDPITGKPLLNDIANQWRRSGETGKKIAAFIKEFPNDYYVLVHGNGPQVGNILLRSEYARPILPILPLDVCVADTQGAMGYMLYQVSDALQMYGVSKRLVTVVSRVSVDELDPEFSLPSKFIGSGYTKKEAISHAEKEGWKIKLYKSGSDGAEIWRRVVPSPRPLSIIDLEAIKAQIGENTIPIALGGGGIPVAEVTPIVENGEEVYNCNYGTTYKRPFKKNQEPLSLYRGVEAVIDKDLAASLLGKKLVEDARARGDKVEVHFAIFTNVDAIKLNYQKENEKTLRHLSLKEAESLYQTESNQFPRGSMGPKLEAAINFVKNGGEKAYICSIENFAETLNGISGTTIGQDT